MEFIQISRKEFRAKLYQTYIASGIQDHVLIQEYIKIAESFVLIKNNTQTLIKKI